MRTKIKMLLAAVFILAMIVGSAEAQEKRELKARIFIGFEMIDAKPSMYLRIEGLKERLKEGDKVGFTIRNSNEEFIYNIEPEWYGVHMDHDAILYPIESKYVKLLKENGLETITFNRRYIVVDERLHEMFVQEAKMEL